MQEKDTVYAQKLKSISPFCFDEKVAIAFDDMVNRSIPYYQEIHQLLLDIVGLSFQEGDLIYDLGCSTGTTIHILSEHLQNKKAHFIGVDNSHAMIKEAQEKTKKLPHSIELLTQDLTQLNFQQCGLVIMNYTLQFIDPAERYHLIERIYNALRPGGIILLSEKIKSPQKRVQDLTTKLYYDFKKRNGYSELEISQKRSALENILIPYTANEQISLLQKAGFEQSEMIFRWHNFASFIGIKEDERNLQ